VIDAKKKIGDRESPSPVFLRFVKVWCLKKFPSLYDPEEYGDHGNDEKHMNDSA
jgi:hypothetical protein